MSARRNSKLVSDPEQYQLRNHPDNKSPSASSHKAVTATQLFICKLFQKRMIRIIGTQREAIKLIRPRPSLLCCKAPNMKRSIVMTLAPKSAPSFRVMRKTFFGG